MSCTSSAEQMWFCWVCREPMLAVHGKVPASTQYRIGGRWRDCHADCYDEYSDGMPVMRGLREACSDMSCEELAEGLADADDGTDG